MSISVTNIGTNSNTSGATLALTSVTVPAGSLIVVLIEENATTASPGTISDGTNTYTLATSGQNNGTGSINSVYYAANASLSAGTITYTKHTSGADCVISAIYSTGIATSSPLDSSVTASAHGSSAAPTVTCGTPQTAGELLIGCVGCGGQSVTLDVNDGWATPPNATTVASNNTIAGGALINMGTSTFTFAPTLSASGNWFAAILGFKPATAPGITVNNVGTASNSSGATLALSGATVPSSSLIIVCVSESGAGGAGSVSDGTNTYSLAGSAVNAGTVAAIFYAANASLSSGTITYTKGNTGDITTISVSYATGIALSGALDGGVTATQIGTISGVSLVSGSPSTAGELFVASLSYTQSTPVWTQDLADGWGAPPKPVGAFPGCGAQINSGNGSLTYAPTLSGGNRWAVVVVGFVPFSAQPFAKYDWPGTYVQVEAPPISFVRGTDLSVLANAGAQPFAKYDWPLSVLPVLNPPGFGQSIDLSALAGAGAKPFAKYDWSLTTLIPQQPGYAQGTYVAYLFFPFAKYDWPLTQLPVPPPAGYVWGTSGPLIPQLGFGKRKPLFIESASGFPASYWPDG